MEQHPIYGSTPDFEAEIHILSKEESGRTRTPLNGIRWDFRYPEDDLSTGLHMIWPFFLGEDGTQTPMLEPLSGMRLAQMFIISRERVYYHKRRLFVGYEFHCHEASMKVAVGRVTALIGLAQS